ncbi:hypothetical protein Fmac_032512 [Flemingia macrophylla]|uniref:DNA recombination and repair protein Rad51-like C-terminal domain-containing protein n=1 Tax=Flemingia macrophylla TaxID=520843 RepID=A0ABD1L551_9FABA
MDIGSSGFGEPHVGFLLDLTNKAWAKLMSLEEYMGPCPIWMPYGNLDEALHNLRHLRHGTYTPRRQCHNFLERCHVWRQSDPWAASATFSAPSAPPTLPSFAALFFQISTGLQCLARRFGLAMVVTNQVVYFIGDGDVNNSVDVGEGLRHPPPPPVSDEHDLLHVVLLYGLLPPPPVARQDPVCHPSPRGGPLRDRHHLLPNCLHRKDLNDVIFSPSLSPSSPSLPFPPRRRLRRALRLPTRWRCASGITSRRRWCSGQWSFCWRSCCLREKMTFFIRGMEKILKKRKAKDQKTVTGGVGGSFALPNGLDLLKPNLMLLQLDQSPLDPILQVVLWNLKDKT